MENNIENKFDESKTTFRDIQQACVGGLVGIMIGAVYGATLMHYNLHPKKAYIKTFQGSNAQILYIENPNKRYMSLWRDSTNECFQYLNYIEYEKKLEALNQEINKRGGQK